MPGVAHRRHERGNRRRGDVQILLALAGADADPANHLSLDQKRQAAQQIGYPPPVTGSAGRSGPRTAPETVSERAVEAVFIELLGQGEYDVDDDFFILGGHSLLATRLCSRLRARYNVDLPLIRVFETPTIRMLAQCLDASLLATVGAGQADDASDERVEGEI